jgi:hypothetical protein
MSFSSNRDTPRWRIAFPINQESKMGTFSVNVTLTLTEVPLAALGTFLGAGEGAVPAGTLKHVNFNATLQTDGNYAVQVVLMLSDVTLAQLGAFVAAGEAAIPVGTLSAVKFDAEMGKAAM